MTPPPTTTGRENGNESTLNPHSHSAASRGPLADALTRSAISLRCRSITASCALTANGSERVARPQFRPQQEASEGLGTPEGRTQELPERISFIPYGCWLLIELRKKIHNGRGGRGYRGRFFVFLAGAGIFFFAKKDRPGVNSKIWGDL